MEWILIAAGVLVVFVLLLFLIGMLLPRKHVYARSVRLRQTPDAVFSLLADVENLPKWSRNIVAVEKLPPVAGQEATRQTLKGSSRPMTIVTTESTRPSRLVRTIGGDAHAFFSGSWRYDITATADGCQVQLTEDAEISMPPFRLMAKLFGATKYLDEHLLDLGAKFGETPVVQ
jgi:hypothetical protein